MQKTRTELQKEGDKLFERSDECFYQNHKNVKRKIFLIFYVAENFSKYVLTDS